MSTSMTHDAVAHYFAERYGLSRAEFDADPALASFMDSIGMFELCTFLEKRFDCTLDTLELGPHNFGTPRQVADWVDRLINPARAT